jgi:hypothetical protein
MTQSDDTAQAFAHHLASMLKHPDHPICEPTLDVYDEEDGFDDALWVFQGHFRGQNVTIWVDGTHAYVDGTANAILHADMKKEAGKEVARRVIVRCNHPIRKSALVP